jgi:hypothetical protein
MDMQLATVSGASEQRSHEYRPLKAARAISTFCEDHSFSVATFYRLKKRGLAPAILKVGGRRLITAEAEQEWKERMKHEQAA